MTRVLHVIDSAGLYGAEQVLLTCVEQQIRLGYEPMIASLGEVNVKDKALELEAERRGLPVVALRMRSGPNMAGALRIAAFARRGGFELIHTHGYKANILTGFLPRSIRRLPVVATLHGWTSQQRFGRMALYQWLDKLALRFVDRVVVVSESMLESKAVHALKRVSVIRNGIDAEAGHPDEPRIATSPGKLLIGAAGRLSPEKGFNFLVESLALLRQRGHDAHLVIAGDGPQRASLLATIRKLRLAEFVQLLGYQHDLRRFLREVDLLCLSSLTEGVPMIVLEAMRAGTPIVATTVGGVPEMLDHGRAGLLATPGDPAALADAIELATTRRAETRYRAQRARRRVEVAYSSSAMAKSYCELYETLGCHSRPDVRAANRANGEGVTP